MNIRQISASTVKISLSVRELAEYRVQFSELDSSSPATVRLLSDAAAEAERISGLPFCSERLFVEAFGRNDGSCLLYLSLIMQTENQTEQRGAVRPVVLCDFSSPQALFNCCSRLVRAAAVPARSALYAQGDVLRLAAELPVREQYTAVRVLAEFGTPQQADRVSLAVTAEHYRCLRRRDAVTAVAGWKS